MRFVPAAVTPLQIKDLITSLFSHMKGDGIVGFENQMATYLGAKRAFSFTSLMRTNYACLYSLSQFDRRKEVVLPRYSCPSFVHAILASGLKVKYCDVNPVTLSYNLDKLFEMTTHNTLALICPNLFGLSNPVDTISEYCKKHNIYLIEGVDYGVGTEYLGKRIGSFGDFSILNFQEGKAIPVGGGMFTTNHEDVISFFESRTEKRPSNLFTMFAYMILSHPQMYYFFMKGTSIVKLNRKRFSMEDTIRTTTNEFDFEFDPASYDKCLSNFQGALGTSVFSKLESHITVRTNNVAILERELAQISGVQLVQKEANINKIHYIRYPIMLDRNKKSKILKELLSKGIEASPMYIEHGMNISPDEFPGAEKVANELLTLPCHPYTSEKDLSLTIKTIKSIL
jgi:perosamine synthetase